MLNISEELTNLFKENVSVDIGIGARIEYNMNAMLQNLTVTTTSTDQDYISQVTPTIIINPFKKLFPVDSIVKPFRPQSGGIKYYIDSDTEYPLKTGNYYSTLRMFEYPDTQPRVYYAGDTNEYKYFVTPVGKSLDVTVKYVHKTAVISEAYSNGSKIFFTTSSSHGFSTGMNVTVTGMSSLNISGIISSVPETNVFTVNSNISPNKVVQNGLATLSQDTKAALTNKIIATFEKFHYVPSSCYIYIKSPGQAEVSLGEFQITNGKVMIHYLDRATDVWEQVNSEELTWGEYEGQEFKYANPIEIEHVRITAPNQSDKIIGLIELSPRWVKDISSDIVSFDIQKESSANSEDILPIGKVTSNSLSMKLARYSDDQGNQDSLQIVNYNFDDTSLDPSLIYMFSKSQIYPYFKIFHSDALSMPGEYDIVNQGTYFIDSWEIKNHGETSVEAFDSAKILMDTIAPERFYQSYTATGVLTALLDSVGFTNYSFNLKTVESSILGTTVYEDNSIPVINYWWSDGRKSVWECIQEICNDIQMNAIFDEDNILQFYSRNYMYDAAKNKQTIFTYDVDSGVLPNIATFSHKEIPSANQVKIIYTSPFNSNLIGASTDLFTAPVSYLAAGALISEITESSPSEGQAIEIQIDQLTEYNNIQSPFSYSGYVVINSEIIEYDAIEYKLINKYKTSNAVDYVWVESEADVAKYQNIAEARKLDVSTGILNTTFGPSNKLRVKKRGALGTTPAKHTLTSKAFEGGKWKAYRATWG